MSWKRLCDIKEGETFAHGAVLRTPAKWPYEEIVDFLLIQSQESPSGFTLIVASGYKAGLPLIMLPKEALNSASGGLDGIWVKQNWKKWIYQDSDVVSILFTRDYHIRKDGLIEAYPE